MLETNTNPLVEVVAIRPFRWEVSPGEMKQYKQGERLRMKESEYRYHRTQSKVLLPADADQYFKDHNIKPAINGGKH
jgi:hypothetical protein